MSWLAFFHITNVTKQWLDAREKAGLPSSLKLYCCRHTFATDALERTGNLAALMKLLGHSDAQTAMRYQHPGIEQIRRAVEERNREHAELLAHPLGSTNTRFWAATIAAFRASGLNSLQRQADPYCRRPKVRFCHYDRGRHARSPTRKQGVEPQHV